MKLRTYTFKNAVFASCYISDYSLGGRHTIKTLVKKYKITETQVLRIKKGENWGHVKAVK